MEKKKNTPTAIKLKKVQTEIRKTREKLKKLVTEEKNLTTLYQTEIMQTTSDYLKDFFKSENPNYEDLSAFLKATYSVELDDPTPSSESSKEVEEESDGYADSDDSEDEPPIPVSNIGWNSNADPSNIWLHQIRDVRKTNVPFFKNGDIKNGRKNLSY